EFSQASGRTVSTVGESPERNVKGGGPSDMPAALTIETPTPHPKKGLKRARDKMEDDSGMKVSDAARSKKKIRDDLKALEEVLHQKRQIVVKLLEKKRIRAAKKVS